MLRAPQRLPQRGAQSGDALLFGSCVDCRVEHAGNVATDTTVGRFSENAVVLHLGCKQKNMTEERRGGDWGNVWTFTAFCRTCKLLPVWRVGGRDLETTKAFMLDLASRMATKFQLSTDAFETWDRGSPLHRARHAFRG